MARLLDLFCCQGGAAAGYALAGFSEIVGVDLEPQPRYPYTFVEGDALAFARERASAFDAIHASPPCQAYSQTLHYGATKTYPDLLAPTIELLDEIGIPYVIENVVGAPLRVDVMLCASAFGLRMRRHRIFQSNVPLGLAPPCNHWSRAGAPSKGQDPDRFRPGVFVSPAGNPNKRKGSLREWIEVMGTPWMDRHGVTQAIPPAYTEFLGRKLLAAIV